MIKSKNIFYAVSCLFFILLTSQCGTNEEADPIVTVPPHRVLWIGTSIPAGCPYPQKSCEALGWDCVNMAIGASGICINQGFLNNARDGKDLAETMEEKEMRYKPFLEQGKMTEKEYNEMLSFGFDKRVIPYIDKTLDSCDIVVIDHGYNDRNGSNTPTGAKTVKDLYDTFNAQNLSLERADKDFDRSNFVEAFCFLVKKIKEANPKIKVVVCSHIENSSESPQFDDLCDRHGYYICLLQQKLAGHFGFPFLNICDYNGFTMDTMPNSEHYLDSINKEYKTDYSRIVFNTQQEKQGKGLITKFQYYCPDGVHPHTDQSKRSEQILVKNVTMLMQREVVPYVADKNDRQE